MAILSAATVGLVKIAKAHSLIRHRDEARLSATLTATNLIENLQGKSVQEIRETIERTDKNLPNLQIRVDLVPVDGEFVTGLHVIVSVYEQEPPQKTENPLVREHFWLLEPTTESSDSEVSP